MAASNQGHISIAGEQTAQSVPTAQLTHEKAPLSPVVAVKPCSQVTQGETAMDGEVYGSSYS